MDKKKKERNVQYIEEPRHKTPYYVEGKVRVMWMKLMKRFELISIIHLTHFDFDEFSNISSPNLIASH